MSEKTNTLEERNESQRKTILRQAERIKELEVWEKFATHLINNCIGKKVSAEALETWLTECQARRTQ